MLGLAVFAFLGDDQQKKGDNSMPRNPYRYPHTPEGLAQKERDMTKNCQPVGLGTYKHCKLFTREKFLEDRKKEIIEEKKNTEKLRKGAKKGRGEGLRTENNLKNMSHMLLEYSMDPESMDVHGFLRNIGLSPLKFFGIVKADPVLADAYEQAKSNFSYNNLKILKRKLNTVALSKYASLHSSYSEPLRAERRKDKEFERTLDIRVHQQIQEERKHSPVQLPDINIKVNYE